MTFTIDIGTMRHDGGATWNRLASQSPFLKGLGEYLFNPDSWEAKPQVWPQLSKKWFDSYSDYQTGETGYALWPVDSQQHALQTQSGVMVDPTVVANVALDMEVDDKYYYGASSGPLGPSGGSGSNKSNKYEIPMKEVFYFNCGYLNLYDQNTGTWIKTRTFDLPQSGDQSFVVNGGWAVSQRVVSNGTSNTGKTFGIDFEWVGPKDQETQLLMYFEIPIGSAPSVDSIVFNSPIEFVARYLRVTKCISCPSGRRPVARHQTMIAYHKDDTPLFYPCFRLGGDDPNSEMHPGSEHFDVFSVEKTLEADYNLELEKYDYETGNPLEGARFELYERFDDQDQVLEEGTEKGQLYEKNFLNKPVKWDDFMVIGDLITNSQGKASFGSHKSYKYQATFCDGHPAPVFGGIDEVASQSDPVDGAVVSPSVVQDANTEMEEAVQEDAAEIAQRWLDTVAACEECANGSAEHFHWLANEEVADALQQVIDGTMTPEDFNAQFEDATKCVGKEEAFTSSGVKDDMEAVYQKFINLKYSYAVDEYQAVDGYALHGVHPDDVKLEIITTTASQTADGDEFSSFAGMYTSDDEFVVNEDAIAGYVPEDEESGDEDLEGDGGDEGDTGETESDEFALSDVNILPFTITAKASELSEDNIEISDAENEEKGFIEETKEFVEETWDSITSFFKNEDEQDGYDNVSEIGLLKDSVILFDDEFEIATPSDALYEVSLIDNAPAYISGPELGEPPEAGEGSGEGGLFPEAYEKATTGEFVLDIDAIGTTSEVFSETGKKEKSVTTPVATEDDTSASSEELDMGELAIDDMPIRELKKYISDFNEPIISYLTSCGIKTIGAFRKLTESKVRNLPAKGKQMVYKNAVMRAVKQMDTIIPKIRLK